MTEPRKYIAPRRAEAKARTREKLIAAARQVWAEPGTYQTQGIREVAAAAGMSTGAVFANWPSKAALWRDAMGYQPPVDCLAVREALRYASRSLPADFEVAA